jgi:hypothetical protein
MKTLGKLFLGFIALCIAIGVIADLVGRAPRGPLPNYTGSPKNVSPADPWSYTESPDPMTGKVIRRARIASSNGFELKSPYEGKQYAILVLSDDARNGRSVMLQITKGQLICDFRNCTIPIRFDNDDPTDWSVGRSSDGDSTVMFIRDHRRFVDRLASAGVVRMLPTAYQNGQILLEFPVAGFSRKKYGGG